MIKSNIVDVRCFCGKVNGVLKIVKKDLFYAQCFCCDCQNYAKHLESEDKILDQYGASSLIQTYPKYLTLLEGKEHINCVQIKEKGLLRWYANCCNSPLANTMTNPRVPFISISTQVLKFKSKEEKERLLGPVSVKAFAMYAKGKKPKNSHDRFPKSYMISMLYFMLRGAITGKFKPHPFFKDAQPISNPTLL